MCSKQFRLIMNSTPRCTWGSFLQPTEACFLISFLRGVPRPCRTHEFFNYACCSGDWDLSRRGPTVCQTCWHVLVCVFVTGPQRNWRSLGPCRHCAGLEMNRAETWLWGGGCNAPYSVPISYWNYILLSTFLFPLSTVLFLTSRWGDLMWNCVTQPSWVVYSLATNFPKL